MLSINLVVAQNCNYLENGTYEYESNGIKVIVEFSDNWQLERNEQYGVIFLNKVHKLDGCKYKVVTYKLLKNDLGIEPKLNAAAELSITEIVNNEYHYEFRIIESGQMTQNHYTKVSEEISDEFSAIIRSENEN